MKNILISTLILLATLLSFYFIVNEANACSVEEAAVVAAQTAYDEALEAVREIEESAGWLAFQLRHPLSGNSADIAKALELETQ